jgi:hypothetical protein
MKSFFDIVFLWTDVLNVRDAFYDNKSVSNYCYEPEAFSSFGNSTIFSTTFLVEK